MIRLKLIVYISICIFLDLVHIIIAIASPGMAIDMIKTARADTIKLINKYTRK